jgi:hypothetical protein
MSVRDEVVRILNSIGRQDAGEEDPGADIVKSAACGARVAERRARIHR